MKKSRLQRRTPLRSTTGLSRTGGLSSSGPVKARRDPCSVEGCDRLVHAHRLCRLHYGRERADRPMLAPVRHTRTHDEVLARRLVRERSEGCCERCGARSATDWHHRLPASGGGEWSAANGFHLCRIDHRWITEHPAEAYDRGWLVRRGHDPATIPVFRRGQFVWLRSDGTYIPALGGAA